MPVVENIWTKKIFCLLELQSTWSMESNLNEFMGMQRLVESKECNILTSVASIESLIDICFKLLYVPITVHLWDRVSSLYGLI